MNDKVVIETASQTTSVSPFETLYVEIRDELARALATYPPFHSAHEGWAVIKEELDELWEEVKKPQRLRTTRNGIVEYEGVDTNRQKAMRKEAIQVAAMAMRFVIELKQFRN